MIPVRVVLDTNVLVSALLFNEGTLAWVRRTWHSGIIVPLTSRSASNELIRVLAYPKFRLSNNERIELLDDYLPFCEIVHMTDPPPAVPDCRDRHDRPFLELAIAGRADALVTGDADLLVLDVKFAVQILSPSGFAELLNSK